jgi:hypothetical protein
MREEQLRGLLDCISRLFQLQTTLHGVDGAFIAKIDEIQTTLLNSKRHKDAFVIHPLSEDLATSLEKLW